MIESFGEVMRRAFFVCGPRVFSNDRRGEQRVTFAFESAFIVIAVLHEQISDRDRPDRDSWLYHRAQTPSNGRNYTKLVAREPSKCLEQ